MKILVTGGAGYIGCHTIKVLKESNYEILVYDNLIRGHREAIKGYNFIEGDIAETDRISQILTEQNVDAVMHFAAHSQVGESVEKPDLYYHNNVAGGISLLNALVKAGLKYFIFSSSAAVYGEPEQIPIKESHSINPTNPYGESKVVIENALNYYEKAHGIKSVSLRYFNAAGADPSGDLGEDHDPETHLIPIVLQVALGQREKVVVFGDDYPTADGSAVRDYIHVSDLAQAHMLALGKLIDGAPSSTYNLGNGDGYSVLEVIKAAERVVNKKIPCELGPRRAGDPAVLVASADKAINELEWKPQYTGLEKIIETAWNWHKNSPNGYKD